MSHCPNRLLVKYSCEFKPLLEDYAPNVFGGYDVRAAGSLECDLSNNFIAVVVRSVIMKELNQRSIHFLCLDNVSDPRPPV
jgi:hypothetical protein